MRSGPHSRGPPLVVCAPERSGARLEQLLDFEKDVAHADHECVRVGAAVLVYAAVTIETIETAECGRTLVVGLQGGIGQLTGADLDTSAGCTGRARIAQVAPLMM